MGDSIQNISKSQLKRIAAHGDPEHVEIMSSIIEEVQELSPFASKSEIKQEVCTRFAKETDLSARKTLQIYNVVNNILQPNFGEVSQMVNAQISNLITQASQNLYTDIYSKEGQIVGSKFDPNVMNAITKAHTVISQNAAKAHDIILQAHKQEMEQRHHEDRLNLQIADKTQLKDAVKQGLINNPDIVKALIEKRQREKDE